MAKSAKQLPATSIGVRVRDDILDLIDSDLPVTTFTSRSGWIQDAIQARLMQKGYLDENGMILPRGGGGKVPMSDFSGAFCPIFLTA